MLNIGYYNNTASSRGFETTEMKPFSPPLLVKSTDHVSNPFISYKLLRRALQVGLVIKNPPANVGDIRDVDSVPGSGRSPGRGHGMIHDISVYFSLPPGKPEDREIS